MSQAPDIQETGDWAQIIELSGETAIAQTVPEALIPVSYTHLTLPTIPLV